VIADNLWSWNDVFKYPCIQCRKR